MRYYLIPWLFLLPMSAYSYRPGRLEQAVNQVMEPLTFLITVLHTLCGVIGGAFIVGAVVRYIQHRYNPGQTPINQPLVLGLLGCVLFGLPFMTRYALVYPHVMTLPNFLAP